MGSGSQHVLGAGVECLGDNGIHGLENWYELEYGLEI